MALDAFFPFADGIEAAAAASMPSARSRADPCATRM
jgi:hypothetical protein